jgi:hypothetical protein
MQEALDTECNFGLSLGSLACSEVSSHWREGSPRASKRDGSGRTTDESASALTAPEGCHELICRAL